MESPDKPSVLLVGNYRPDRQRSMLRYAGQLERGLREAGWRVERFDPPVCFGRFAGTTRGLGKWLGYLDKYFVAPLRLWWKARGFRNKGVVHICDHSNAHYVRAVGNRAHTVTCHDMLAVRSALGEFPGRSVGRTGRWQQAIILRGLRRARHVTCVSSATAADLRRLAGKTDAAVNVIPNALAPPFDEAASTPWEPAEASPPYLLHVGGDAWYKNRDAVLRVFRILAEANEALRLRVVGPSFDDERLGRCRALELKDRIDYPDSPDDEALLRLYANASLLVFPSVIEGFGWPILEAQAAGCPVLTSATAPMAQLNASDTLKVPGDPATEAWAEAAAASARGRLERPPGKRREAAAGLKAFASTFTFEKVMPQHLANYAQRFAARTESP